MGARQNTIDWSSIPSNSGGKFGSGKNGSPKTGASPGVTPTATPTATPGTATPSAPNLGQVLSNAGAQLTSGNPISASVTTTQRTAVPGVPFVAGGKSSGNKASGSP